MLEYQTSNCTKNGQRHGYFPEICAKNFQHISVKYVWAIVSKTSNNHDVA